MVYRGHVENGLIQLEGSVTLPRASRCAWRSYIPLRAANQNGAA